MSPTPTARPETATTRNNTIKNWTSSCHVKLLVAPISPPILNRLAADPRAPDRALPGKLRQSSRACRTASTGREPAIPTPIGRLDGLHLVRPDFCVADHLAPFLEIVLDELGELLGRAGVRHQALARELLAHFGQCDDRADLRVVFREEVRTHSRGRPHAYPQVPVVAGHALLVQRGNVWKQGTALLQALAEHL